MNTRDEKHNDIPNKAFGGLDICFNVEATHIIFEG